MIASVDHGFVLLANPKCASTALESAFGHVAEFTVSKKPHWKHLSYRQYREIFGDYFERNGCEVFGCFGFQRGVMVSSSSQLGLPA